MQFLYQPLTWGFVLVGVPILIHLINMLRHRKVRWAAMDFLLESHKRNRRWVMLKQWLLLASRMLAMFLLVTLLAKWISGSQWLAWLGGQTTHHYVLIDDSYSMASTSEDQSAYDRALAATTGLVKSIANQPGQHQLTLVRWSRAALALSQDEETARMDVAADLLGQSISQNPESLLERINATEPTSLSLAPEEVIELVTPLVAENSEQTSKVYLVSDLRRNEFGEPDALKNQLQGLVQNSAEIQLVDCAVDQQKNLSLVSIEPEKGVWSAGVPLMVRFQVRNRQEQVANSVVVRLKAVTYAEKTATPQVDQPYSGEVLELPAVVIDQIAPGETVTRQTQVIFGVPGHHVVEASLEADTLATDNRRWCSLEIKESQNILVIDGDVDQSNAFYLENVFNPNPQLATGLQLEKQDTSYLRDVAPERLSEFDVVALLDVPRMDPQAVAKLEDFARDGGGIFLVAGKNTNLKFSNEALYRDGEGLLPAEFEEIVSYSDLVESGQAQVVGTEHPVLGPLMQLEASPFGLIRVRQMIGIGEWDSPGVEVVANGPGGRPILIDSPFERGRVLTLLTGFSNDWSNWVSDPTFVVMMLRSMGYLGNARKPPTSQPVGSEIDMVLTNTTVLPEAEVIVPARGEGMRVRLPREVETTSDAQVVSRLNLAIDLGGADRNLTDSLLRPGVFEAWMTDAQGNQIVRSFARNVSAAEGDLEVIPHSELTRKLGGIPHEIQNAEALSNLASSTQDSAQSNFLMVLLVLLLLGEQALAYSASYHAPSSSLAGGRS